MQLTKVLVIRSDIAIVPILYRQYHSYTPLEEIISGRWRLLAYSVARSELSKFWTVMLSLKQGSSNSADSYLSESTEGTEKAFAD